MADGDAAAALGWSIVSPTEGRNLGYQRINQALDKIAGVYVDLRDNVKPAIGVPVFSVTRSTVVVGVDYNDWKTLPRDTYATPLINTGFDGWSSGLLTIKKPGVYQLAAHMSLEDGNYYKVGLQIVRNTNSASTTDNTLAAANDMSGDGTLDAFGIRRLVAGDTVRLLAFQQQTGSTATKKIGDNPFDLTLSALWLRS